MTLLTDEAFVAAIHKAVEDKGADYVYPTYESENDEPDEYHFAAGICRYALPTTGEPACIIGRALYNIDPKLMPDAFTEAGASEVLEPKGASARLIAAANLAQSSQDGGETWGEALAIFDRVMAGEL